MTSASFAFIFDEESQQPVQIWRDVSLNDDLQPQAYNTPDNFKLLPDTSPVTVAWVEPLRKESDNSRAIRPTIISRAMTKRGGQCIFNERPVYLLAEIHRGHLDSDEKLNRNQQYLAKVVSSRGKVKPGSVKYLDDCGHMLARALGGPMLHFNLFPQDKIVNEGGELAAVWWAIENHIKFLLKRTDRMHCRYEVRLFYGDQHYPNRPLSFKVKTAFFLERDTGLFELRHFRCESVQNEASAYETLAVPPFNPEAIRATSAPKISREAALALYRFIRKYSESLWPEVDAGFRSSRRASL